jgi:hypothetical protein
VQQDDVVAKELKSRIGDVEVLTEPVDGDVIDIDDDGDVAEVKRATDEDLDVPATGSLGVVDGLAERTSRSIGVGVGDREFSTALSTVCGTTTRPRTLGVTREAYVVGFVEM